MLNLTELALRFEHTVLKPDAVLMDIRQLCEEAIQYNFRAVCVAPFWIEHAKSFLQQSNLKIATVIGFPHGNTLSTVKAFEATEALLRGADELDMVMNIGSLKSKDYLAVTKDIALVVDAAKKQLSTSVIKVILETALLTDLEIKIACELAEKAGVDYVKTSTGFANQGATVEAVRLMKQGLCKGTKIKAAGGIRDLATALALLDAGADTLGASCSPKIMHEAYAIPSSDSA